MTDEDRLTAIRARAEQPESRCDWPGCSEDPICISGNLGGLVCRGHFSMTRGSVLAALRGQSAQLATMAAERADLQGALMDAGVSVGPHLPDAVRALTAERDALQRQVDQMVAPEELRQWRARAEALEGKALAYDDINTRGQECWDYCQRHPEGRFGRNIWHNVLDDALKFRSQKS